MRLHAKRSGMGVGSVLTNPSTSSSPARLSSASKSSDWASKGSESADADAATVGLREACFLALMRRSASGIGVLRGNRIEIHGASSSLIPRALAACAHTCDEGARTLDVNLNLNGTRQKTHSGLQSCSIHPAMESLMRP